MARSLPSNDVASPCRDDVPFKVADEKHLHMCVVLTSTGVSILISSVSFIAQNVEMTISVELGILARPVSTTMLVFLTILDGTLGRLFYSAATFLKNRAAQTCDQHCGSM